MTSHKSQGASVEEPILIMAPHSLAAANLRQFYVSNTRFKERHRVFVHDKDGIIAEIGHRSERMLARELLADMGKELNSLIVETRLTALKARTDSDSKLHEHERRMEILVKKIDRHLSQVKSGATRNTIVQKLNLKRLPEAIGKLWRKLRQRRRSRKILKGAHADFIRRFRSGLSVFRWYRRAARTDVTRTSSCPPTVRIVVLSMFEGSPLKERALAAGANAYLS